MPNKQSPVLAIVIDRPASPQALASTIPSMEPYLTAFKNTVKPDLNGMIPVGSYEVIERKRLFRKPVFDVYRHDQ